MGRVEEHLPICDQCRYRVTAFDRYRMLGEPSEHSLEDRKAVHPN
jgi:hypothetical protein